MVIASKINALMKNGKLKKGYTMKEVTSKKTGKKRMMYFNMTPRGKAKPKTKPQANVKPDEEKDEPLPVQEPE